MHWIAGVVAYLWLTIVAEVWGFRVAALCGVSMLAVALLALWEGGRHRRKSEVDTTPNPS